MRNTRDYVTAYDATRHIYVARKITPTGTISAGRFYDMSCTGPYPVAQYYASDPLVAKAMYMSVNKGIYHGGNVSPKKKYLHSLTTWNNGNGPTVNVLADVLMYYPFIDLSVGDLQELENPISLPRYSTGDGVMMIAVSQASPSITQNIQVTYTNSDGVAGRTTPVMPTFNGAAANIGMCLTGNFSLTTLLPYFYLGLQGNDRGVRSVQSVTCQTVDSGLMAILLVKPLLTFQTTAISQITEIDCFKDASKMPQIYDDAYLTVFSELGLGTLNSTTHTYYMEFITGD